MDDYVIGIRLALENGVSEGLASIRADLASLDAAIAHSAQAIQALNTLSLTAPAPRTIAEQPLNPGKSADQAPNMPSSPPQPTPSLPTALPPVIPLEVPPVAPAPAPQSPRTPEQPSPQNAASPLPSAPTAPVTANPPSAGAAISTAASVPTRAATMPTPAAQPSLRHSTPPSAPAITITSTVLREPPLADHRQVAPATHIDLPGRNLTPPPSTLTALPQIQPRPPIRPTPPATTPGHAAPVPDAAPNAPSSQRPLLQSPAAPQSRREPSGPTTGDIYLDGERLGHWLANHLAHAAEAPPSGGTAFDPRLGIAWPTQGGF